MPSLLDLAPPEVLRRQVKTSRGDVDLSGIGAEVWAQLHEKHPTLVKMLLAQTDDLDRLSVLRSTAAVIAAGTGHPLERDHELAALGLSQEDQTKLLLAIMEISSPGDMFGPLLDADGQ